jgi:hypothetical protein
MGQSPKKITAKNFVTILEFQQLLLQGLWFNDDPLLQLPGFTMDIVKNYRRQLKEHGISEGSISTFAKLDAEKRAKLNLFDGDANKVSQLEKVIKALPIVECKAEAFTEGETSITMSDAITLKFTVTYPNYAPNEAPGYVHSTNFPFLKRQKWYLIVSDGATKE